MIGESILQSCLEKTNVPFYHGVNFLKKCPYISYYIKNISSFMGYENTYSIEFNIYHYDLSQANQLAKILQNAFQKNCGSLLMSYFLTSYQESQNRKNACVSLCYDFIFLSIAD